MSPCHELFLQALQEKKIITLTFTSIEKGTIFRKCICYDFAVSKKYKALPAGERFITACLVPDEQSYSPGRICKEQ